MSGAKDNKDGREGEAQMRKPKRKSEKLIRLSDLLPKANVSGGRQLLFGATDINQTKKRN